MPIIIGAAVNMALDAVTQYALIESGAQKEFHWGSFVASGVSGAATAGLGQAFALGRLGANTFGAFLGRNLINSAVDFGIRSAGIEWDAAHSNDVDKGKEYRNLLIASSVNFGSNMAQGITSRLSGNAWDPGFEKMKESLQFQKNYGISSWANPYRDFSKFDNAWIKQAEYREIAGQKALSNVMNSMRWGFYEETWTISIEGTIEYWEYKQKENYPKPPDW